MKNKKEMNIWQCNSYIKICLSIFQLMVYNDDELVNGCPFYFRVLPHLTKIKSPGMDPCAIESIVEVLVNSYGVYLHKHEL